MIESCLHLFGITNKQEKKESEAIKNKCHFVFLSNCYKTTPTQINHLSIELQRRVTKMSKYCQEEKPAAICSLKPGTKCPIATSYLLL